ncbi:hypothetical protein BH10CYA1_BH10CYA1_48560 [soil metagenome]
MAKTESANTNHPEAAEDKAKLQAHQDANAVAERLRTDGSKEGYSTFLGSVDHAKSAMKPTEFKQYSEQLSKDLENQHLLPELALNWTEHAIKTGKLDLTQKGTITAAELHSYTIDGAYDPLTKKLATAAEERLTPVMKNSFSSEVSGTQVDNLITLDSQNYVAKNRRLSEGKSAMVNAEYLSGARPELDGKSLREAADLAGAYGDKGKVEGHVGKQDFEALLKDGFANLSSDDRAFVQNMVNNWDKPEFARMGNGGTITDNSVAALRKENAESEAAISKKQPEQKVDADLQKLSQALNKPVPELDGQSLFQAMDKAGAYGDSNRIKNDVQIQDAQALLNAPFASLKPESRTLLEDMVKNWNDPKYARLRDGETITLDSLTAANNGRTIEEQRNLTQKENDQKSVASQSEQELKTRQSANGNGSYLLEHKVDGVDLITAAIKAGGSDRKSASKEDYQALLKADFAHLSEDDSSFIRNMVNRWADPEFVALRDRDGHISVASAKKFENS